MSSLAVHLSGRRLSNLASKRFDEGSPHKMRFFEAMSSSLMAMSSLTGASPRKMSRHIFVAWDSSLFAHEPSLSLNGLPVGRTNMKELINASSTGPVNPGFLRRVLVGSLDVHFPNFLVRTNTLGVFDHWSANFC